MSTGCTVCSKIVFVKPRLKFCSRVCKLQYYQGMAKIVQKSLNTLSVIGEPFETLEKGSTENITKNTSKVVQINSIHVENRVDPGTRLFSSKQSLSKKSLSKKSSSSSPKSSSTVLSTTCSPNHTFRKNTCSESSTLLQNYAMQDKDAFYGTFRICNEIDSSTDFHKFIHKCGSQRKFHTAQSKARAGQLEP